MAITREDAKNYFIKLSENEPEDYYFQFIAKCDIIPNKIFASMENRSDIRPEVINFKIPKVKKPRKLSKKAYYALIYSGDRFTEKATGFITGSNNMHGARHMVYLEFVANSLIIEQDDKKYIPAWVVIEKGLWDFVNKDDKMTI